MAEQQPDKGKMVVAAGLGINLALGVLYAWSVFKEALAQSAASGDPNGFLWDPASLNDPYAVACLAFALGMIPAGKLQDAKGPRPTAFLSGLLIGGGLILISLTTSYTVWVLGFGVLVGLGIAFGYAAATPAAIKWFPPNKTGTIAGLVVAGFGLAPVYIAPLTKTLLGSVGLQQTMFIFGVTFLVAICLLSMLLQNPPAGYKPKGFVDRRASGGDGEARASFVEVALGPMDLLRQGTFWLIWLLFFIGAGAGLMVVGSVAGMAKGSLGAYAFLAAVVLAVGNAGGRVVAGVLCDRIGPKPTMITIYALQAALMFLSIGAVGEDASPLILVLVATFIGFNYGANLSMFPAFTKDIGGVQNFGVNYGLVFTAWGIGGFVMSRISQTLVSETGSFSTSFMMAGVLLAAGVLLGFLVKDKTAQQRRARRKPA